MAVRLPLGMSAAMIAAHPVLITLARKFNAWDPWHDVIWFSVVLAMATTAIWFNLEAVRTLTLM